MSEGIDSLREAAPLASQADNTDADDLNDASDTSDTSDLEDSDQEDDERLAVAAPHVAMIGQAKSGKSSIVHALFGSDVEPTLVDIADRFQGEGAPIILDNLPSLAHDSESSVASLFSYLRTARDSGSSPDLIWYTLDASGARVTDFEIDLLRRFASECPLIIALTRCDLVAPDVLDAMRSTLIAADIQGSRGVFSVAADPLPALGIAPYGLDELIDATEDALTQPANETSAPSAITPPHDETTSETPFAPPAAPQSPQVSAANSLSPAGQADAEEIAPSRAEERRDPIHLPAQKEQRRANTLPAMPSSTALLPSRRGTGAGQMLIPAEDGPSTMSLVALAAVIALAIALLLLQLRKHDEEEKD